MRGEIDLDAAPADQLDRAFEHGQRLQAEEVELHQPGLLDIFHVELGDRHVGARIAVHRHQLRQRPVADDDAGGVRRGVAVEAFELLGDVEQASATTGSFSASSGKARLALDRLGQRHRIGRVLAAPSCRAGRPGRRASAARGRRRAARRAPAAFRR